ncbi:MAG: MFS transporter, partial [Peptococcaceae bacterium]|nr:MFS transporter [Peptococcaceae bacterium]
MNSEIAEQRNIPQESTTIWSRSFVILFFSNMVFNMGMNMSNSLLSIYSSYLGATATVIGLVASSMAVSSILLRPVSAPIMDTYNRKYLVIFAALMLAVAFWGFGIAGDIPTLIGFRLLQGCAMAFGNASCLAMVADILPRDKYNSGLGYYSLAQVACSAVGPSVGLALVDWVGYQVTYTLTSGIMILAAFLTMLIKTNFKKTKKLKFSFHNAIALETLLPVSLQFIIGLGGAGVYSFLILFA